MPKLTEEEVEENKKKLFKSWEENKGVISSKTKDVAKPKKSVPSRTLDLLQRLIIRKK